MSFNCEGVTRNNYYLTELLSEHNPAIVFLQETWLPYSDKHIIDTLHPSYKFIISSADMFQNPEDKLSSSGPVWHGVAIGWRTDMRLNLQPIQSNNERIAGIKIMFSQHSLLLVSLYAPTSGKDEDFLETMSILSDFLRTNRSQDDQVLIGADTNCSTKSSSRRQVAWKGFCLINNLVHHSPQFPTFHHHNGSSHSQIDAFAASSTLELGDTVQHCTMETPHNLSSHDPIRNVVVLREPIIQQNKYSDTYADFKRQKIIWESSKISAYQQLAEKALSQAISFWNTPESIPVLSSLMSTLLVRCATMIFPTKTSEVMKTIRKPPFKIRQAQAVLKKSFKAWKSAGKPNCKDDPLQQHYRNARAGLQRLYRYEKNLASIRENNHLMHLNKSDKSRIFARVKKLRGNYSRTSPSVLHTPVGTFTDTDVLEGFAADAEFLGKSNEGGDWFDQGFYKLCKLDNLYIFELSCDTPLHIPPMTLTDLNRILKDKMKSGKACDIYQLTVEHLRNCGDKAKQCILAFVNRILFNIYFLSCQQIKLGLGTAIYKSKNKPVDQSSSYRRVTVTPILGAIIDYYLDPMAESIFRPTQSPDQLGFTAGISYLLAAVQRGECQRWAVDKKITCFGVSLDGESAFPSVERSIQIRELYSNGERGDILKYSKNTYENTDCHIKMQDKISRRIHEFKGNRQGHVRASGHFKAYVNSCLLSLKDSNLGFQLGPIPVPVVCVADDAYLLANTPSSLQALLDIMSHFANKYQLKFNAGKTKIVVTGSKADMAYFKDIAPWTLNGEKINVVDSNEHLGLVVAGCDEEQRNVDKNIVKCRNSIFALLGPAFSFKCLLSPLLQLHLWRTCCYPTLISGLPALPIRPAQLKSMELFQRKILRGFLKLSQRSPVPAVHFLLGELPVEGLLHIRTLNLLHNIWSNPTCTIFTMIMYILKMCSSNSTTWANHVQLICQKYGLPPPLALLQTPAWSKSKWDALVKTRITTWHERYLRGLSQNNSKMKYLNVQLSGLTGRPHPVLQNIQTTQDCKKLRLHLKFLTCDLITDTDSSTSSLACILCNSASIPDSTEHVLMSCHTLSEVRSRMLPELMNTVYQVQPMSEILSGDVSLFVMTQFILDCSSPNLPCNVRIPAHNPRISEVYRVARDWCFAIASERFRLLRQLRQCN